MKRKCLAVGIILLFVGSCVTCTTGQQIPASSSSSFRGKWLYVGGYGANNYSRIQDAINDSENGDTVFVYETGLPYFETLTINTSIHLMGEDKNSTILDGTGSAKNAITVNADAVLITGFTIQNANKKGSSPFGISIKSNHTTVEDNIIINNCLGIELSGDFNLIQDNMFRNNTEDGINVFNCKYNRILRNSFINSQNCCGIDLDWAFNNNFSFNTIRYNIWGIGLWAYNGNNTFYQNNISDNWAGVILESSSDNNFLRNNFMNNRIHARFSRSVIQEFISAKIGCRWTDDGQYVATHYHVMFLNFWDGNYWNQSRVSPYPIFGRRGFLGKMLIFNALYFPTMVNFDFHPAQQPYDIPGVI